MNQKKTLRRIKKQQKKVAKDFKNLNRRKEFVNYLLNLTGNSEVFIELPKNVKDAVYSTSWPQILIDLKLVLDHPKIKEIEENIRFLLDVIKIKFQEKEMPVSSVQGIIGIYSIIKGVILDGNYYLSKISSTKITKNQQKIKTECVRSLDICRKILENLEKTLDETESSYINSIGLIAGQEVLRNFSFQEKCLFPRVEIRKNEKSKKYPAIVLDYFNPKEEWITIDELSRKAYLCKAYTFKELIVCTLPPNSVNNKVPLQVYVQEHAINRLFERIGIEPKGYIFDCIGRSILLNNIVGKDGPCYLLEFDYYNKKLGYLLLSNEGNFAVIKSFKFLTMSGTPEFYKLKKLLKGSREDFEYLGLDSFNTLVNSDIQSDETLRNIFDECGVGHLFDKDHFQYKHNENLIAEEIKQYFKLS